MSKEDYIETQYKNIAPVESVRLVSSNYCDINIRHFNVNKIVLEQGRDIVVVNDENIHLLIEALQKFIK